MELADRSDALAAYTDDELLVLISMKDDPDSAERAFNEFYKRYKGVIYPVAYKFAMQCTKNFHELAQIVFNNTFYNVFCYAGSFSTQGETNPEVVKKRVIGWLVAIVRTEIRNQFSSQYDREEEHAAYMTMKSNAAAPLHKPTPREVIVSQAIEQIRSERDREIFYTYWFHYQETPGGIAKKLPDDVYDNLAKKYSTTEANIRQIISRTKKLVSQYIAQNTKR
jgi:hypothetical protein